MECRFETINDKSDSLDDIIALGDSNKSTLGLLPRGAFKEIARRRQILAAFVGNNLTGYLLFRINQGRQTLIIVHLCISEEYRGKNLSTALVDEIINRFGQRFSSIGLTCRDDYEHAIKFWSRYGFKQGYTKRSRSIKEHYSTYWYKTLKEDLFSQTFSTATINAILDANIIVKLRDDDDNEQIKALKADWITKEVDFCFTRELLMEFQRDKNIDRRNKSFKFLRDSFEEIEVPDSDDCNRIYKEIKELLHAEKETPNNISDRRQLAEAITSKTPYFITLDDAILGCSDPISERYELAIMTPLQFIISIDKIENYSDYQPKRLAGADIEYRKAEFAEIDTIRKAFLNTGHREYKEEFTNTLQKLGADESCSLMITKDFVNLLGVIGFELQEQNVIIHILRTVNTNLGNILFKQLITESISLARKEKATTILLENKYLPDQKLNILSNMGFRPKGNLWKKQLKYGMVDVSELLNITEHKELLPYDLERLFFPVKIMGLDIPTYIVPIRSYWASQLFDYVSANASLEGSKAELTWNRENVYYRSSQQRNIQPNSRILWYLSGKNNNARNSCIIGCSYLDDVEVDKPKILWGKYKRIGVYEWKHVYEQAKFDIEKDIMAMSFSDTEVFNRAIPLAKVQKILGNKSTFQSPLRVTSTIFDTLYKLGNELQ